MVVTVINVAELLELYFEMVHFKKKHTLSVS